MVDFDINYGLVTGSLIHDKLICLNTCFYEMVVLQTRSVCHLGVVTFAKIKYLLNFLTLERPKLSFWRNKMAKENKCVTPRCRGEPYLSLLGKWLCKKCWDKHCEESA
jgi:hypothetical protein